MSDEPHPQPEDPPPPPPPPPEDPEAAREAREARIAASYGAQVVLDPDSEASLGARGALADTVEENTMLRDRALVERAGDAPAVTVTRVRDPVGDPENDHTLAARGVKPVEPAEPAV